MRPTSASRPGHKLAPVRREGLFLMLLLLCYCCLLWYFYYCCLFNVVLLLFFVVLLMVSFFIFIIILFFYSTSAAVSWLKMATRSGSGSWSHPPIVVFTLTCKIGNLCKIWQLVPPMVVLADLTLPSYIVDVIFRFWNILSISDFGKQLYSSHIS